MASGLTGEMGGSIDNRMYTTMGAFMPATAAANVSQSISVYNDNQQPSENEIGQLS